MGVKGHPAITHYQTNICPSDQGTFFDLRHRCPYIHKPEDTKKPHPTVFESELFGLTFTSVRFANLLFRGCEAAESRCTGSYDNPGAKIMCH